MAGGKNYGYTTGPRREARANPPRQRVRSDPDALRRLESELRTGRERIRAADLSVLYGNAGGRVVTFPVTGTSGRFVSYRRSGGGRGLVLPGPLLRDGRAITMGRPRGAPDYELFATRELAEAAAGAAKGAG